MQFSLKIDDDCLDHVQIIDPHVLLHALLVLIGVYALLQRGKGSDQSGNVVDLGQVAGFVVS